MARPANPTVRRRELASALRRKRVESGHKLDEAARALEISTATMSRIETGVRLPRARDVRDLCALYGNADAAEVASLLAILSEANETGWWETYTEVDEEYATWIGLEAAASAIYSSEAGMVPSLLQTEEYTRAFLREAFSPTRERPFTDHDVEKRTEVRRRRQETFTATDAKLEAIVDESALTRVVGSVDTMRRQVEVLLERATRPDIDLYILPFTAGAHMCQLGGFIILTLPQRELPDVAYLDLPSAGQIFIEATNEVDRHKRIFKHLKSIALAPAESAEWLARRLAEYV